MIYKIYTDGGARGNPGPAAAAFVVYDGAGVLQEKRGKYLGKATNNEAEYRAVIEALNWAVQAKRELAQVDFFLDANLVASQLNGMFKVKEARLRELLVQIRHLEGQLSPTAVTYSCIPRAQNAQADQLVNETLDASYGNGGGAYGGAD